jgi:hypothetical protein
MPRSAHLPLLALLALSSVACGTGKTRDATAPLSPAAQKIEVVKEAAKTCKKLGTATARGRDADENVADAQALDGAKEEAVKLGGDTIVIVTQTNEPEAGGGGTVQNIKKTIDVFSCGGAK